VPNPPKVENLRETVFAAGSYSRIGVLTATAEIGTLQRAIESNRSFQTEWISASCRVPVHAQSVLASGTLTGSDISFF
jgi:hypothetical protein